MIFSLISGQLMLEQHPEMCCSFWRSRNEHRAGVAPGLLQPFFAVSPDYKGVINASLTRETDFLWAMMPLVKDMKWESNQLT